LRGRGIPLTIPPTQAVIACQPFVVADAGIAALADQIFSEGMISISETVVQSCLATILLIQKQLTHSIPYTSKLFHVFILALRFERSCLLHVAEPVLPFSCCHSVFATG